MSDDELQLLLAERAITRVLHRYAQGVDRRNFDQIEACYWPDGYDEHGSFSGPVPDYIAWLKDVLPKLPASSHQYTNILIDVDLASGTATSEAYCFNVSVFDDGQHLRALLRYLDEWQRRDGEWRVFRRVIARDWARTE